MHRYTAACVHYLNGQMLLPSPAPNEDSATFRIAQGVSNKITNNTLDQGHIAEYEYFAWHNPQTYAFLLC